MQINAEERGRRLILTVGGRTPDMTELEAAEADEDVVRVSVPPVSARTGSRLFAFYAGIAFARQDSLDAVGFTGSAEEAVVYMTKLALGAVELRDGEGGSVQQRNDARARWDRVQGLRWDEAQAVCNAALFWNLQGGGIDTVRTLLDESVDEAGVPAGGLPKAQAEILEKNGLSDAFGRLQMLLNSELEIPTPSLAATPATSTPSGSESSSPSDDGQPSPPTPSEKPKTPAKPRSRSKPASSTTTSSGASRSSSGTRSPRSTSTSSSGGTTRTSGSGTSGRGSTSTPESKA